MRARARMPGEKEREPPSWVATGFAIAPPVVFVKIREILAHVVRAGAAL